MWRPVTGTLRGGWLEIPSCHMSLFGGCGGSPTAPPTLSISGPTDVYARDGATGQSTRRRERKCASGRGRRGPAM